jgi:FkbM family methyltransferase
VSLRSRVRQSQALNWTANYVTPRNIARYLGCGSMSAAVEILWARQRRAADLTVLIADIFAQSGDTVVDVGASWGLFSYHLARRVGERGRVYSYEPHPANATALGKLMRSKPNVRFRETAVSDVAGRSKLLVPTYRGRRVTAQSSLAHGFERVGVEQIEVQTVTLDDEIGEDIKVDFVKIDVEGHELAVLRGGAAMFRRCAPPILIEIEQRHLSVPIESVFRELEALGYEIFYIDGSLLRAISGFDVQRDQLSMIDDGAFRPFSMPEEYICNFCAVSSSPLLRDLPMAAME